MSLNTERGNLLKKIADEQCGTIHLDFNISTLENSDIFREINNDDDDDGFETCSDDDEQFLVDTEINDDQQQQQQHTVAKSLSTTQNNNNTKYIYHYEYGIIGEDSHTYSLVYKNRLYNINIKYEYIAVHSLLDALSDQPMTSIPTMYQALTTIPAKHDVVKNIINLQSRKSSTKLELQDGKTISNHFLSNYISTTLFSRSTSPVDISQTHSLFKAIVSDETLGMVYTYGGADFNQIPRLVSKNFLVLDLERLGYVQFPIPVNIDDESEELLPMEGHSMVKRQNKIYIFGGNTTGSLFMNSLYEIDVTEVDKFCMEVRKRDFTDQPMDDLQPPTPKFKKIIAKNHDNISTRSYHTCEYIPKYDIMVSVAGKVRKGADAPMLNEILIYHFNRNEFQIIGDSNILNPRLPAKDLPYAHVLGSTRLYGYDSFSNLENCYQMAYYGGCKNTDYDSESSYDPHMYILTFKPSKQEAHNVDVLITKVLLKERISSSYTSINYVPQTSSFYLFGSYQGQSRDEMSIFTMKFASTAAISRQFPKLSPQSHYHDISCISIFDHI